MKARKLLWKVSVTTTPEAEDAVTELLEGIFHCPVSSFFDLERKTTQVTAFVQGEVQAESLEELRNGLDRITGCGLDVGTAKISAVKIRQQDWAESWKRHFKPIEIGNTLLVKPGWSRKRPRKGQAVVVLDPGLSFGTGQHPTTAYCLEAIAKHSRGNASRSFLDIGTGSAILAIAAAKLGYRRIRAIDFDAEAIRVARGNARANDVLKKMKIACGDVATLPTEPLERFDLICANLISDVLVKERKRIIAQLNSGGVLVLAGILKSEFVHVQKKFEESGLKLIGSRSKKEWRSGSFALSNFF
jgi:ribosomal protein L11 methyltransferase